MESQIRTNNGLNLKASTKKTFLRTPYLKNTRSNKQMGKPNKYSKSAVVVFTDYQFILNYIGLLIVSVIWVFNSCLPIIASEIEIQGRTLEPTNICVSTSTPCYAIVDHQWASPGPLKRRPLLRPKKLGQTGKDRTLKGVILRMGRQKWAFYYSCWKCFGGMPFWDGKCSSTGYWCERRQSIA